MCVQLISRTRNPGSWKADCTIEAIKLDCSLGSPRSLDCPHPDDLCLYVLDTLVELQAVRSLRISTEFLFSKEKRQEMPCVIQTLKSNV